MIVTTEQRKELMELSKPLIKWLNDNCHPHCSIQLDQSGYELYEGVCSDSTLEYIKGLNRWR